METLDLGFVKTTKRVVKGKKQEVNLYTREQRERIIEFVENKPADKTVEQILEKIGISAPVYYTWLRSEKSKKEDFVDLPNPLFDLPVDSQLVHPSYHLREFYLKNKRELNAFLDEKFREWVKNDIIVQLSQKITPENAEGIAEASNITVEELKSFLKREKLDLSYFTVEAIKDQVGLNVK